MLSSIILIIFPASPVPADLSIDCRPMPRAGDGWSGLRDPRRTGFSRFVSAQHPPPWMCWPENKLGNLIRATTVSSGFCTTRPWFDAPLCHYFRGRRLTGSCHEGRYSMPPICLRAIRRISSRMYPAARPRDG